VAYHVSLVITGMSAEGRRVVYRFSGRMTGPALEGLWAGSCGPGTEVFPGGTVLPRDTSVAGMLTRKATTRTCAYETLVEGTPAKARFTLSERSRAGGSWKWEVSVVGGPWTVVGEGNYHEARPAVRECRRFALHPAVC
jgi:hypothetical protein